MATQLKAVKFSDPVLVQTDGVVSMAGGTISGGTICGANLVDCSGTGGGVAEAVSGSSGGVNVVVNPSCGFSVTSGSTVCGELTPITAGSQWSPYKLNLPNGKIQLGNKFSADVYSGSTITLCGTNNSNGLFQVDANSGSLNITPDGWTGFKVTSGYICGCAMSSGTGTGINFNDALKITGSYNGGPKVSICRMCGLEFQNNEAGGAVCGYIRPSTCGGLNMDGVRIESDSSGDGACVKIDPSCGIDFTRYDAVCGYIHFGSEGLETCGIGGGGAATSVSGSSGASSVVLAPVSGLVISCGGNVCGQIAPITSGDAYSPLKIDVPYGKICIGNTFQVNGYDARTMYLCGQGAGKFEVNATCGTMNLTVDGYQGISISNDYVCGCVGTSKGTAVAINFNDALRITGYHGGGPTVFTSMSCGLEIRSGSSTVCGYLRPDTSNSGIAISGMGSLNGKAFMGFIQISGYNVPYFQS